MPRKQQRKYALTFASVLALSGCCLLVGCKDPAAEAKATEQAVATAIAENNLDWQHRQTLAVEKATAEATAKALEQSNITSGDARRDGFDAGQLAGRAAATAELQTKIELVRSQSYESGKVAGEALAAAANFERGLIAGEEKGRLVGRDEAREANEAAIDLAVERATASVEKVAFREGEEAGRREAKLTEIGQSSIPMILAAVAMLVVIFFALSKRDGRSAAGVDMRSRELMATVIAQKAADQERDERQQKALLEFVTRALPAPRELDT